MTDTSPKPADCKPNQSYLKRDHPNQEEHDCPIEALCSLKFRPTANPVFFEGFLFIDPHRVINSTKANGRLCKRTSAGAS